MAESDSKPYGVVYCITNKVNGKKYIGQTTLPVLSRWSAHCNEYSGCRSIAGAIKKHGKESFTVEVLRSAYSKEELNLSEIELIEFHGTRDREYGYNLSAGGLSDKPSVESKALMALAKIGRKASELTRRKMSDAKKGIAPSRNAVIKSALVNTGRPLTEAHRKKLSDSHKGHKPSPEAIAKIVAKTTGQKRTAESCERISASLTGKKRGPISEEHKRKIAEASKGRVQTQEARAKISAARKGKPLSDEHRKKLSEARQAHFAAKKAARI